MSKRLQKVASHGVFRRPDYERPNEFFIVRDGRGRPVERWDVVRVAKYSDEPPRDLVTFDVDGYRDVSEL